MEHLHNMHANYEKVELLQLDSSEIQTDGLQWRGILHLPVLCGFDRGTVFPWNCSL